MFSFKLLSRTTFLYLNPCGKIWHSIYFETISQTTVKAETITSINITADREL